MILLPDIVFEYEGTEHRLSLQDPYTLDGKLVTNVYIDREPNYSYVRDGYSGIISQIATSYNTRIMIKNRNHNSVTLDMDSLETLLRNFLSRFFVEHDEPRIRVGENSRYSWSIDRSYNITAYINDLSCQCQRLNNSFAYDVHSSFISYFDTCMERLYAQGRHQTQYEQENRRIREREDSFTREYYTDWNIDLSRIYQGTIAIKTEKKYIHQYNYKPEYIKHYIDNEQSSLLLGAEIEVDCGGESEKHAKEVLKIMCGANPDKPDELLEDKMYCMHDGSLTNGIEFVTMPCSLEYHKQKMNYKEMFEYLDKNGYKAHDTSTCGLHIHADRSYLGKSELVQQLTISKILYILEKFNDEICVIARRDNRYSQFVGNKKDEKSVIELYGKYKSKDKYVALNLKHDASIEFRCFRGTLKYETFILTLEFVKDIIDYAKSINIEEIELIKWNDLMNTFSDELKEYYSSRLEKEKNKENKEEKKSSSSIEFRNGSGIIANYDGVVIHRTDVIFNHEDTERLLHGASIGVRQLAASYDFDTSLDSLRGLSEFISTYNDNQPPATIESKKKEIKSLKKRIKNCNNYMEKRQLNEELTKAQKELKRLKRESRTSLN